MPQDGEVFEPQPGPFKIRKRNGYQSTLSLSVMILTTSSHRKPQDFNVHKLQVSLRSLTWSLDMNFIDLDRLVHYIQSGLVPDIPVRELQMHAARIAASMCSQHPDYNILAGRILTQMIHKEVDKSFKCSVQFVDEVKPSALTAVFTDVVIRYGDILDAAIKHHRDFDMTYQSINTFTSSYLLRTDTTFVERPQHVYMRIAVAIHSYDIDRVLETYEALSLGEYTHASPVIYNAGTTFPFYASCYQHQPDYTLNDPLQGLIEYDKIWMADGGISISLGTVPSRKPTPCNQPGLMPLIRVLDSHAQYNSLARRHRMAGLTAYLPIWHAEVRAFIISRTTRVSAAERIWRVFPALWIPDIFMNRLRTGGTWSLFDPVDVPELNEVCGDTFSKKYEDYEHTVKPIALLRISDLWHMIVEAQQETGTPFIVYGDHINAKNNQRHMGMIHGAGLCCDTVQYSSPSETGVGILSSIALPRCIKNGVFDFDSLQRITRLVVTNTDLLIDLSSYPTESAARSALHTRAVGVGVQGLWDVFTQLKLPVDSAPAKELNIAIFETVYYAALDTSCELARLHGPYSRWSGSPGEHGELQMDMWKITPTTRHDFSSLRDRIWKYGLRNSVLTTQMPTASTANLLGNCAGTDPYTSNLDLYRTRDGDLPILRRSLIQTLVKCNLWTESVRTSILSDNGSIQSISDIPDNIKLLYRTVWEIDPKVLIDLAADRAPFIDQSQSTSIYTTDYTPDKLANLQLYAWERGLKTGVYDLRTRTPRLVLKGPHTLSIVLPNLRPPPFPFAHEIEVPNNTKGDSKVDEATT